MYVVVPQVCDICNAECVSVMPVKLLEEVTGCECQDCGNMSMWPQEKE